MTVAEKKLSLLQQIMLMEDEAVISRMLQLIQEMKPSKNYESYGDLPPQVRESIEISRKQLEEGEGIPYEDVMTEIREKRSSGK